MAQVIEDAVKALTEFESALDQIRGEAVEREKRLAKEAAELSDLAKVQAMAKAKQVADERVAAAREAAEREAAVIRQKGEDSLKLFEDAISKKKAAAATMVVAKLMGARP